MKINKIYLKDYKQFKKLEIDLTYPKGHKKEGQPLDKVCFIGQSGTGKTSLLRLIKFCSTHNNQIGDGVVLGDYKNGTVKMDLCFNKYHYQCSPSTKNIEIGNLRANTSSDVWFDKWKKDRLEFIENNKPILINFPTERVSNEKKIEQPEINITIENKLERELYLDNLKLGDFIDFAFEDTSKAWEFVLSDIKKHQAEELIWKQKIADLAIKIQSKPEDLKNMANEYQNWLIETPNPLDELAKNIDVILNEFGVKIKTDVDKETILHLGNILIQTIGGEDLSKDFWSTGTKQIIDTAVPLIEIKPKNAIILIDEPERSLYPNLQQKIIDFYTNLGKDCQFFFATHSPIIASAFDPWEIIELKFDENNIHVIQETNFKGSRNVNNYTVYPKYLEWGGILMNLFDLKDEGSQYRADELLKMVALKNKLELFKKNGKNKGPAFKKMLNEFIQLKQKVGWNEKTE